MKHQHTQTHACKYASTQAGMHAQHDIDMRVQACARDVHTHLHSLTHSHTHTHTHTPARTCLDAGDVLVKQHYVRGIPLPAPSRPPRSVARAVPRGQRPMKTCCPAQGRGCAFRKRFAIRFSMETRDLEGGAHAGPRRRHLGARGRRGVRW